METNTQARHHRIPQSKRNGWMGRAVMALLLLGSASTGAGCLVAHVPTRSAEGIADASAGFPAWSITEAPASTARASYDREEAPQAVTPRDFANPRAPGQDASTFSVDVDTASYTLLRQRLLKQNELPGPHEVRIEEILNYFAYDDAPPAKHDTRPFAIHAEIGVCPWRPAHHLVRVALKGKAMAATERPPANLVLLIDISESMSEGDKMALLRTAVDTLLLQLNRRDRVAVVTFARESHILLEPTPGDQGVRIREALAGLRPAGSTHAMEGMRLAYQLARDHHMSRGINRVILCSDGDFDDAWSLAPVAKNENENRIDLTVLGFGAAASARAKTWSTYNDNALEDTSNQGDGNYFAITTRREAEKVLADQLTGTLATIARDVKAQVFFNPARVGGWRLIGYENRRLNRQDFNNDAVDAAEIGAGHAVVALYEIVPAGAPMPGAGSDPNPYIRTPDAARVANRPTPGGLVAEDSGDWLTVRLRYKLPGDRNSQLQAFPVLDAPRPLAATSRDYRWSAAVAGFGLLLQGDAHRGGATWDQVHELAHGALGTDREGHRGEFLHLIRRAQRLAMPSAARVHATR